MIFRKISTIYAFLFCLALFLFSCDDETGELGVDMVPNSDLVERNYKIYDVTTSSYEVGDKVLSRSSVSYLGKFTDPETGTVISSDFLAQFYCPENFAFPDQVVEDKITDVELRLYIKDFIGDSLATFKLNVYQLDKAMDAEQDYYTNINPEEFYDSSNDPVATKWYSISDRTIDDDIRWSSDYTKSIRIKLPTDLGQEILNKYKTNPELFENTDTWIKSDLPFSKGFYFQIESGDGAIAYIDIAQINISFRYYDDELEKDTTGVVHLASTEEVVQATRFQNDNLSVLMANKNATYLKSPAGIFTEASFPIDEINITDTINAAQLTFTRYNDLVDSKFKLSIPKTILLVRLDDYQNGFFENYKLADGVNSYITAFNANSNTYEFTNIAKLLNKMKKELKNGTASPNFNKVLLIPVEATYDSSGSLVKLAHDFSMTSAKLVGGENHPLELKILYSNFK